MILAMLICVSTIIVCAFNAGREVEREEQQKKMLPIWKRLGGKVDE